MAQPEVATHDLDLREHLTSGKNPRGIPTAVFILDDSFSADVSQEDVEVFLERLGHAAVETAVGAFNELYSKFKYMEASHARAKEVTKGKVPEIERTLELVRLLKDKQDSGDATLATQYSLADTVYAKAVVECSGTVCLWLGANVMLEYAYDEAMEVLQNSLKSAREKLRALNEDLEHLRNQCITVEVSIARLVNYDVRRRKLLQAQQK